MVDLWDSVAGTADHLAGSTDEAVGRLWSQSREVREAQLSGDLTNTQAFIADLRLTTRHLGGPIGPELEDFAFESPSGSFMGNEDTIDVIGPTVGQTADVAGTVADFAVQTADEGTLEQSGERLAIYAVLAVIILGVISWVFGPIIEAATAASGG